MPVVRLAQRFGCGQARDTTRWHRKGFRLFWRWKSRPLGRPRLPKDLQALIRQMAAENLTWGQERIANELKLKLAIRVSPRTVGKYLAQGPRRAPDPSRRWLTFVRNHAEAIVACDFLVVVTARFRILYVFVLMELGRRRILHVNVTDHPSADWTGKNIADTVLVGTDPVASVERKSGQCCTSPGPLGSA